MKTSLKKLQKFTAHRPDKREQKPHKYMPLDEHARATQGWAHPNGDGPAELFLAKDLINMRDCYDRLLSAAATTANSVYEFSESLREMGDCLLEKTALNDDEESGKVLLMLGKKQFELLKLVDGYRSHIFQTITVPSESLLNELRIVEEMKKRCDGKREIYEELLKKQKEKARLRQNKSECFTSPQLKEAYDEYDEEANVFVFRIKSLKQGQSRSFLTQASRHHAAQLYFFKRASRSLETIEPHVRLLAEQLHIDYHFNGLTDVGHEIYDDLDDDESDGNNDTEDGSEHDDGELSFDYGRNGKNSMELDNADMSLSAEPKLGTAKEILRDPHQNSFSFQRGVRAVSKSAPLFQHKKPDSTERMTQLGPSPSHKFTSYVLPTPDEMKSPSSGNLFNEASQTRQPDFNLRHSAPFDKNKYKKLHAIDKLSGSIILDTESVLKESNCTPRASPFPPPLSEGLSSNQLDPNVASYAKKAKRQAFSGPLIGNHWPNTPNLSSSAPTASSALPLFSGSLLCTTWPRPTSSAKLSSNVSSTFVSSPKISELHELPRPPAHLAARRPSNRSVHSGPLISSSHELSTTSISMASVGASRLPIPPLGLSRSYSIPTAGPTETSLRVPVEGSQNLKMADDVSPPPISLPEIIPAPHKIDD